MPVDLNTLVSEVLSDLEVLVERTQGKVEVGTLPTIDADPTQMRQLFQNLIGNALKFRKKDVAPLIRVSAEPLAPENQFGDDLGPRWQIRVQDNGIGFDEKYRGAVNTKVQASAFRWFARLYRGTLAPSPLTARWAKAPRF